MPRHFSRLLVGALAGVATVLSAADFKLNGHTFTLPEGFELELVAGTNLVDRPISASFDEQGRLYVTDSSGSNEKVEKQIANPDHRIVRLEDTDGDGRFDKSVVFADKMMFPEGALWYEGSLYVAAVPSIWKLTDTNNDGVADVREEWFKGKTATGCANDLHGPYLGPDGWIYWTKGAFAEQEIPHHNKPATKDKAAHIFRARPDGSMRESFLYGGMDNPVEVAWTDDGELFFTCTFIQHPAGGKRDALVHGIYGGVYGKDHDVIESVPRTGPLLEPMTHLGPAAPSGLCAYKSRIFGDDFHDNLFVTQFNLRKVSRHVLHPMGATFRTSDSDFMVSDHPDFHPTDVLEDADGSLLVVDTGGWYKMCCPTSQMAKPDVMGAIYRIRRKGAKKVNDPRGLAIQWQKTMPEDLVKLSGDERPAVSLMAIRNLVKNGNDAMTAMRTSLIAGANHISAKSKKDWFDQYDRQQAAKTNGWPAELRARANVLWALTQINTPEARVAVTIGARDVDNQIRYIAYRSMSLNRDAAGATKTRRPDGSIAVELTETRIYCEMLGRTGTFDTNAILHFGNFIDTGVFAPSEDRALQHSFSFALMESGSPKLVRWLANHFSEPGFRPGALIAMEQMDGKLVKAPEIIPLFTKKSLPDMRSTAYWILSRHPEWAKDLVAHFQSRVSNGGLTTEEQQLLGLFVRDPDFQQLIADKLRDNRVDTATRLLLLGTMAASKLKTVPIEWTAALNGLLSSHRNESELRAAVTTLRAQPKATSSEIAAQLQAIARDTVRPVDLRIEALAAIPGEINGVDDALLKLLQDELVADKSPLQRNTAASVLARAKLSDEQLIALCDSVKTAGPMEVPKMLEAYGNLANEPVGLKLIASLKESRGVKGVRPDVLRARLVKAPASVKTAGEELILALNADAPKQKARLEELAGNLGKGDIRRGQLLFHSTKAACMSCHQIGYVGGKVGPDLSRIGSTRTDRDLLEAIVFPSASFVRSYEPVMVATKGGEEFSGVLRGDNAEGVTLITGLGAEQRIARAEITDIRPGTVSVMPEGLDQVVTGQELADLVAFLKSMK